jgi:hypothetical protein
MKICGGVAHHKWIRGAIAVSPPVFYYALALGTRLRDNMNMDVGTLLGQQAFLFRYYSITIAINRFSIFIVISLEK